MTDINAIIQQLVTLTTTYGLDIVGAVVILIIGWLGAGWVSRMIARALARSERVDPMLRGFFASLVRYFVLAFTVLAVLSQFGVQTASLIAVFGAAGLAIGLALQGTLSNLAAGVMLMLFRPFKVGDYIKVAGVAGTVKDVSLFVTEFATPDNVQILAPNGQIWGSAVKNYSHHETRRMDLVVGIAYEDKIDPALDAARAVLAADGRVLTDPAPMVVAGELADSSVNLIVRFWCRASDYWAAKFDLTKALKERFDQEGITIPYPQRTLHLVGAEGAGAVAPVAAE